MMSVGTCVPKWNNLQILSGKLKAGLQATGGFVFQIDKAAVPIGLGYGGGYQVSFLTGPQPAK